MAITARNNITMGLHANFASLLAEAREREDLHDSQPECRGVSGRLGDNLVHFFERCIYGLWELQIVRIAEHVVANNGVCQVQGVNGRQGQGGHSFDPVLFDTSRSETVGAARTRARARVSSVTVVVLRARCRHLPVSNSPWYKRTDPVVIHELLVQNVPRAATAIAASIERVWSMWRPPHKHDVQPTSRKT